MTIKLFTENEKRALCENSHEKEVLLNDKPAFVAGTKLPFAVVACKDNSVNAVYSWNAVERILNNTRHFTL